MNCIPVSAVVVTKDRAASLARTLDSLLKQEVLPSELIVVDGSVGNDSRQLVETWGTQLTQRCAVRWFRAEKLGAAPQRNQGVVAATQSFTWFFDDDILFEPDCVRRLWEAIKSGATLGGVNAMIVNQRYQPPGFVSRVMFTIMYGKREASFAGKVIGPAVNLLPEDRDDLPEVVPVEWLNTTCSIYRREALPSPPFDSVFTGYSVMEDLTLSLRVGRQWKLANVRTARIRHDSQPGLHKADISALAAMEVINRHYVMTEILGRKRLMDFFRLVLWEAFQLISGLAHSQGRAELKARFRGQLRAMSQLRKGQR